MGNGRSKGRKQAGGAAAAAAAVDEGKSADADDGKKLTPAPSKRVMAKVITCIDDSNFRARIHEALAKVATRLAKEDDSGEGHVFAGAKRLNRTLLRFNKIRDTFSAVERVVRKYDLNKDGTIQFSELSNCIKDLSGNTDEASLQAATKEIFTSADMYSNESLSFKEFLCGLHIG